MSEPKKRLINRFCQKNRPWLFLLMVILFSMSTMSALADMILEPMGVFKFSIGIDGNFDFTSQSGEDRSYGETYIECLCDAQMHNIQTTYQIEEANGCPFEITLEQKERKENETGSSLIDAYNIICTPNGQSMEGGRYPFIIKIHAQCGENSGWTECTIDLDVALTPNQNGLYEYNGNYYKIYEGEYTWDEAKTKCEEMGGYLATISSAEEQEFMELLNSDELGLWIGGYRDTEHNWYWVTGEAISYTNWGIGEPNNGYDEPGHFEPEGEDRINLWPYEWNDAAHDSVHGFVCEWGALSSATPKPTPTKNPDGSYLFRGNTYMLVYGQYTWDEAKAKCEEMGGHLVTITSAAEQKFIEEINMFAQCLWIGGYRDAEHNWYWVTGEEWSYTNWEVGEPNNSSNVIPDENRVSIWPDKWNDLNQNNTEEQNGYICEIEGGAAPTPTPAPTPDSSLEGDIADGESKLDKLPPVKVPTLVLPDGTIEELDLTLKFNGPIKEDKNNIKYDVRLVDSEGNKVELPKECILCFPYPEGLDETSGNRYRIMIHHLGDKGIEKFSTEDGTIDLKPQGLCIRISSLSPFIIEWEELPEADLPQTGDNSNIALWLTLLTVAGAMMLTLKRKTA